MCNFAKLLGHDVTVDTPIPGACHRQSRYCITVSVLLIEPGGRLILVHHPNAEDRDLTPLQTTVRLKDGTLGGTAQRALKDKLGLTDVVVYERAVNTYLNIVPRGNEPCKAKTVVVFVASMMSPEELRVDCKKVLYVEALEPEMLADRLPKDRPAKCAGTLAACLTAATQGGFMSREMQRRYHRALSPSD